MSTFGLFYCIRIVFVNQILKKSRNNSKIDMASGGTSGIESGAETPSKRRKLEEKNTKKAIIEVMTDEINRVNSFLTESDMDIAIL